MLKTIPNIEAYPKTIQFRDGTLVKIRPLAKEDKVRLMEFFLRVPEDDRHYLRENVTSPRAIKEWTEHLRFDRVIPIVALVGDRIVADASLHRGNSPANSHVGEIRIVVDPDHREIGIGGRLLQEMLSIARNLELSIATMELVDDAERPALAAAKKVGFHKVATLPGRIKDSSGSFHDLLILQFYLEDLEKWGF